MLYCFTIFGITGDGLTVVVYDVSLSLSSVNPRRPLLDPFARSVTSSDEDSDEEEQRVQAELARDRSNTRRSMDLFLDGPILGDGIVESVAVNPPLRRSSRNKA